MAAERQADRIQPPQGLGAAPRAQQPRAAGARERDAERLRLHEDGALSRQEVDRILAKVSEKGVQSLSDALVAPGKLVNSVSRGLSQRVHVTSVCTVVQVPLLVFTAAHAPRWLASEWSSCSRGTSHSICQAPFAGNSVPSAGRYNKNDNAHAGML